MNATVVSMIVGIGSGLESVSEVRKALQEDAGWRDRVFTVVEIEYCGAKRYPEVHYAARLAAKSAALKALKLAECDMREISTRNSFDGCPNLELSGSAGLAAGRAGVRRALLSLTHTRDHAAAFVVLES